MHNSENNKEPRPGKHQSVLIINCGSSSVKFALIDTISSEAIMTGLVERLNSPESQISWKINGEKQKKMLPDANLVIGLGEVISIIPKDVEIVAIGHRVVHGAEEFSASVVINDAVIETLKKCIPLAPLHNPANIAGIQAAQKVFPGKPQVAVFDTAFHQTLKPEAYLYAVPYEWYQELGVRRYGFHGTSHRYVTQETAKRLKKDPSDISIIIAHLGNGCSACAVEKGKSTDTTMGLSPLEGLVMGTRSGDIDPALHEFISNTKGWNLKRIMNVLNKESGLLGLSGKSNDMRTLVEAADAGNERAQLAIDVFSYRLAKSLMGLTAALSKLDAIVFTGGIGENSSPVRAKVISRMKVLGIELDPELNAQNGDKEKGLISSKGPACLVVPTNEELMIARETLTLTQL